MVRAYYAHDEFVYEERFVPVGEAVTSQTDKRAVLARMEKYGLDWFPVVSETGRLVGIVDRSLLIANTIFDLTNRLEASKSP